MIPLIATVIVAEDLSAHPPHQLGNDAGNRRRNPTGIESTGVTHLIGHCQLVELTPFRLTDVAGDVVHSVIA